MNAQDLLKEIDKDRDSHIAFLRAFVQAPSPNPPGDTRAAVNIVIEFLQRRGIKLEIFAF